MIILTQQQHEQFLQRKEKYKHIYASNNIDIVPILIKNEKSAEVKYMLPDDVFTNKEFFKLKDEFAKQSIEFEKRELTEDEQKEETFIIAEPLKDEGAGIDK